MSKLEELISAVGVEMVIRRLEATGKYQGKHFRLRKTAQEHQRQLLHQLLEKGLISQETYGEQTNDDNYIDVTEEMIMEVIGENK